MGTEELGEIFDLLKNRGWQPPVDAASREAVAEAVEALTAPRFCGVAAQLGDGNQYCGFPETIKKGKPITYFVRDGLPAMPRDILRVAIKQCLAVISASMQIDFTEVESKAEANILYTAANLGGPFGVLADAQLCICGIEYNSQFQSIVRIDSQEEWVNSTTMTGRNIDAVRTLAHETIHSLGGYHINGNNLMAPQISELRALQEGDIRMLEGLGYKRRTAPVPTPAPAPQPVPTGEALGPIGSRILRPGTAYTPKKRAWVLEEL